MQIFGIDALPKVLGLLGVMTLPFTFVMSPAAGWLHDLSGNYDTASAVLVAACSVAAVTFLGMNRHLSGKREVAPDLSSGLLLPADPR